MAKIADLEIGDLVEWHSTEFGTWLVGERAIVRAFTSGEKGVVLDFFDSAQGSASKYSFSKRRASHFSPMNIKKIS